MSIILHLEKEEKHLVDIVMCDVPILASTGTKWCIDFSIIFFILLMYSWCAAAAAKSLQPCPTLCDPIDGSPPGSPVPGILQARILEWVAISFSNAWKWKAKVKSLSRVRLLATPWTAAYQGPPSMDFPGKCTGVGCHGLLHTIY